MSETGSTLDAVFRRAYAPAIRRIANHGVWDWPQPRWLAVDIQLMEGRRPKRWRAILRDVERCPKVGDEMKYHRLRRMLGMAKWSRRMRLPGEVYA